MNVSMDMTTASNYQLYDIIQNTKLDALSRQAANDEFNSRNLSIEQIRELMLQHDVRFVPENETGLSPAFKLLLIVCPFFIELYTLIAGRMLANGEKRKWKEYRIYVCLGYLTWTIAIILFAKYGLFKT